MDYIVENPIKWMIWGYHYFRKHPYTTKQYLRQVALLQGLVTRSENLLGFDETIVSFAEIRRVTMQVIGKSKKVDTMKPCIMPHSLEEVTSQEVYRELFEQYNLESMRNQCSHLHTFAFFGNYSLRIWNNHCQNRPSSYSLKYPISSMYGIFTYTFTIRIKHPCR